MLVSHNIWAVSHKEVFKNASLIFILKHWMKVEWTEMDPHGSYSSLASLSVDMLQGHASTCFWLQRCANSYFVAVVDGTVSYTVIGLSVFLHFFSFSIVVFWSASSSVPQALNKLGEWLIDWLSNEYVVWLIDWLSTQFVCMFGGHDRN